jgi:cytochrome oxidase Cu insertion factor (SCO1/SenC/PrrC family)
VISRSRLAALVLALGFVVGAAVGARAAGPDFGAMSLEAYEPPKPAPAFSLPDVDGRTWTLAELKGKVVLLFFWATW